MANALPRACRLTYHALIDKYYSLDQFEFCSKNSFVDFTNIIGTFKCNLMKSVAFGSSSFINWRILMGMQGLETVKIYFSGDVTYKAGSIHHNKLLQLCRTSQSLRRVELDFGMKQVFPRWNIYFRDTAEKKAEIDRCVVELNAIHAQKFFPSEGPQLVYHVYSVFPIIL